MYHLALITKWESPRDSYGRIPTIDTESGRVFLINPSRIVDIEAYGTGSKFYFVDNPSDRRERQSVVWSTSTPKQLKDAHNIPFSSKFIQLNFYKYNNINQSTYVDTINVNDLSYADRYNPSPETACWICYNKHGFKRTEQLVAMRMEDLLELAGGSTTTTIAPTTTIEADVEYGLLYNWFATSDERQITSEGYLTPTLDDFITLATNIGGQAVGGAKLKEIGTTYWNTPNLGATNEYGFNARGTGQRIFTGVFSLFKMQWSCHTRESYDTGWHGATIQYNLPNLNISVIFSTLKQVGTALRPMRAATITELLYPDGTPCVNYIGNNGVSYPTVKIGTQVWTTCNLIETHYRNGDVIPEVTDNATWATLTTGALCAYNNNWDNV